MIALRYRYRKPYKVARKTLTFEGKHFVPARVKVSSFDICLKFVLLIRQQQNFHIRITGSWEVFGRQFYCPHHF